MSSLVLVGCASNSPSIEVNHSALALRQFQKKEFHTTHKIEMIKAVMGSLQDIGFTIKNANADLGLISAEIQVSDSSAFSQYMQSWIYKETTIASVKHWEATINIDVKGEVSMVRASFLAKALNKVGGVIKSEPILEPKFYQDFFTRVDKALFLSKNQL
jgi:hypothetical protein